MHSIVQQVTEGKNFWSARELQSDPSLLPSIHEAQLLGLILGPRFEAPATSSGRYGVPLIALVPGLTARGHRMAAAAAGA